MPKSEPMNVRAELGLEAAEAGDVEGLRRFIGWVTDQYLGVLLDGELPRPINDRIEQAIYDGRHLEAYLSGFLEGKE